MTAFNGKYELTNVEGMKAFYDAIKSPEEFRAKLRTLVPELKANPSIYTEELQFGGGKLNRKVFVKGELQKEETLTIGSDNDIIEADGRPAKETFKLESDHKAVFHDKGADFEFTVIAEITGSTLVVTSIAGSATSVLTYKKL